MIGAPGGGGGGGGGPPIAGGISALAIAASLAASGPAEGAAGLSPAAADMATLPAFIAICYSFFINLAFSFAIGPTAAGPELLASISLTSLSSMSSKSSFCACSNYSTTS